MIEEDEDDADGIRVQRPDTKRSIRVIRTTRDGVQKEVSYSALDKDTQREVITDLLVKSAVHYALSKQEVSSARGHTLVLNTVDRTEIFQTSDRFHSRFREPDIDLCFDEMHFSLL